MDQETYAQIKAKVFAAPDKDAGVPAFFGLLQQEYEELLGHVAHRDAAMIRLACNGMGTDDNLLIKVLCSRTRAQIQRANAVFVKKNKSNKTITATVKSECSGNYGSFMTALAQDEAAVNAEQLKGAFGMMTNTKIINELFTTLSNDAIIAMRKSYEASTDENLYDKLQSKLGGQHEKLILDLLQKGRSVDPPDAEAAAETAKYLKDLIKAGSSMMGGVDNKTERRVIDALRKSSPDHCTLVQEEYEKVSGGKSLRKTIQDKFSGALEEGLLCLLSDPVDALCLKLKNATEGMGCDEKAITRIIGGSEKPLVRAIVARYQEKYDVDFRGVVKNEAGGHFEKAVLAWIDSEDPTRSYRPPVVDAEAPVELTEADVDALIACIWGLRTHIANFDYYLLCKAGKGIGTDEAAAIDVLCSRTKSHIEMIDGVFRAHEGGHRSIDDYIQAEFGGNLQDFLSYTQMEEDEFDAITLFEAFKGLGCDEGAVVEVLTTRSWKRLHAARVYYEARNDKSLMDDVIDELSGNLEYFCCRMVAGSKAIAEKNGSNLICTPEEYAEKLYNAGAGKFGTDEKEFINFITGHSLEEIQQVAAAYEANHGSSLEGAIRSEFSGDLCHALVNMLFAPNDVFAKYIKEYCDGVGTNEEGLNRVLAGNDKDTVQQISARYFEKYGKTLADDLRDELSGDYETAALRWIKAPAFSDGFLGPLVDKFALPPPPEEEIVPEELPEIPEPKPEVPKPPGPTEEEIAAENERLAAEQEEAAAVARAERAQAAAERAERQARLAEEEARAEAEESQRLAAALEEANDAKREELEAEQAAHALRMRLAAEQRQAEEEEEQRRAAAKAERRAHRGPRMGRGRRGGGGGDSSSSESSSSSSSDSDGGGGRRPKRAKAGGKHRRAGRADLSAMRRGAKKDFKKLKRMF
jgi:hypothetical protein